MKDQSARAYLAKQVAYVDDRQRALHCPLRFCLVAAPGAVMNAMRDPTCLADPHAQRPQLVDPVLAVLDRLASHHDVSRRKFIAMVAGTRSTGQIR